MDPHEKIKELSDFVEKIISWAEEAGADEVLVSASHVIASRMNYEKNDFNIATHHEGTGFGLSIHKDDRSGSASINTRNEEKIKETIENALKMAKYSIPDPYLGMADKADYVELPMLFDPKIVEMSMKEKREHLQAIIEETKKDSRISLDNASFDCSYGARVIGNSKGMVASDASTSLNWSLMGMAIDGEDITSFDYIGDYSSQVDGVDLKYSKSASILREKLLACLGAGKGVSYQGQILLKPAMVDEFLVDPLIYHLQGVNIMDGKSRFAEDVGKKVADEHLTIEDRPHDIDLKGCTAFSGEGVPTTEMTLVENGVIRKQVDSVYSANRRGTHPTGNGGGPHSVFIPVGKTKLDQLRQVEGHLLEVGRFSGNVDAVSGDFSGVAKGAHLYKDGKHLHPVKEVMISGNIFEVLNQPIVFEDQHHTEGGHFKLPHARVDGISVTAG